MFFESCVQVLNIKYQLRDMLVQIGGFHEGLLILGDWNFDQRFLTKADICLVHESLADQHIRVTDLKSEGG